MGQFLVDDLFDLLVNRLLIVHHCLLSHSQRIRGALSGRVVVESVVVILLRVVFFLSLKLHLLPVVFVLQGWVVRGQTLLQVNGYVVHLQRQVPLKLLFQILLLFVKCPLFGG